MSFRATFLILAAAVIFHVSVWETCLVLVGYFSFARLDEWLAKKAKEKVIDDEMEGWETDPDNPEYETKGDLSRVKLTGKEQIVAARVAHLLRRIP